MRPPRALPLFAGLLAALAVPPAARADFDLELAFFADEVGAADLVTLSPKLGFEVDVGDKRAVIGAFGVSYSDVSLPVGDGDTSFDVGNPFLGIAHVNDRVGLDTMLGIGVGIPLASVSDAPDEALLELSNYGVAMAMRGLWDAWLWAPETLSFAIPARFAVTDVPLIHLRAEAAAALLVPISDTPFAGAVFGDRDTEVDLQLGAELGALIDPLVLALRLQAVLIPTGDDAVQTSIEPFAALRVGGAEARLGFLINLDRPAGPSFDDDGVWALRLMLLVGR